MTLLDTDVCIAIIRGHAGVLKRSETCGDSVGVASMTAAELLYGAEKSSDPDSNRTVVERFLSSMPVYETDENVVRTYGYVRAYLEKMGTPMSEPDLWIGATALSKSIPLATGNTRHFRRIFGLRLQNWFSDSTDNP